MTVFDTHCHMYDERFDEDREEAYARMLEAGVKRCVCVGCDVPTSRLSIAFAQAHPGVWATAGVHPQEAKDAGSGYLDDLRGMLRGGANDGEIEEAIREAISEKPIRHAFYETIGDHEMRGMNEIGG